MDGRGQTDHEEPYQAKNSTHLAAEQYAQDGWSVIPVPHMSKNPGFKGWEQMRLTKETLGRHFNGCPKNIGVLLGDPSGGLADIDLDHPVAVELAPQYLPATPAIFGRASKRRSHWIYRVTSPIATKRFKSKTSGMLVEVRSTGTQTVFPPSVHESGEPIEWETEGTEPALVDPDVLLKAAEQLVNAVRIRVGEQAPPKPQKTTPPTSDADSSAGTKTNGDAVAACLDAMLRMRIFDQNDGSSRLFAAACRVVEHDLSDADAVATIREYSRQKPFPRNWSDEQILARIRDAEKTTQRGTIRPGNTADRRPNIVIDTDEHRVVCETVTALASDPETYHRGGILVRVVRDSQLQDGITRCNGSATISALPLSSLRERMTKFESFIRLKRQNDTIVQVPTHPTAWLVNAIHSRADWPDIRYLAGISDVPILRSDGTLWQTAGYDRRTGVLFEPSDDFPLIADNVGINEAHAALESLLEVVCDFKFENDDHRAAWLAGLLTPFARHAFEGPAPLFLIDANVRGAGKGLLAQTIGQIVLAGEMPVSSYVRDSEEMRKKITAIALAGDQMVLLDNIEGHFGNDALDRALTTTRWKDRLLGTNQQVDLPLRAVWYGTGNNVIVGDDTTRRIIHIRLDVLDERPEERKGFRHPDLPEWIKANRPRLVMAALTILVAYLRKGNPQRDLPPFGSYEAWSRVVREAVVWAGLSDPCRTRTGLAETANSSIQAIGQVMTAWLQFDPSSNGIVVAELLAELYPTQREQMPTDTVSEAMRGALENIVGCPPGKPPGARQVGNKLRHYRRRVIGGVYLDTNPNEHRRSGSVWRLHAKEVEPNV